MSETPRTSRIMDHFHIASVADTREQSISHREEAQREIENLETELTAARAGLAKAHRRIHGDESEDCVFCSSKKQTPGGDDPQCYLCALEANMAALRAEQAKPLDRPDKPGYWWRWCDIFKKWEGPLWISLPAQTSLGKWLPASPPRDLREGGK